VGDDSVLLMVAISVGGEIQFAWGFVGLLQSSNANVGFLSDVSWMLKNRSLQDVIA
jgi:hypothetical protein